MIRSQNPAPHAAPPHASSPRRDTDVVIRTGSNAQTMPSAWLRMPFLLPLTALTVFLWGCGGGIDYSRTLFEHIPDDPQLLVLVQPNELADFTQKTITELALSDWVGQDWDVQLDEIERYQTLAIEIFGALGIPWSQVHSAGVLVYFEKPVFLACGEIDRDQVMQALLDLGFTQNRSGTFNYIYDKQKLLLPKDGLIMMAEEDLLEFLMDVPDENRLWNRKDFAEYRLTSPLDNTVFIWSQPPKSFLGDFPYHDQLGAISLAVNLEGAVSIKNCIRLRDPQKTVILYDLLSGGVSISRAAFAQDPVYGSLFRGIEITQDNNQVVTSLVIPADQVKQIKTRLISDLKDPNPQTFAGLQRFFGTFK